MSETYGIIESIKGIMAKDIEKIKDLGDQDGTLDPAEARKLTEYLKVLIHSNKDEREELKRASLQSVPDEELEDLVRQASDFLQDKEFEIDE